MRRDHNVCVSRVRPLWHPAPFFEVLQKGVDHSTYSFGAKKSYETVLGTKGVPKRERGIRFPLMDEAVKRAVVTSLL